MSGVPILTSAICKNLSDLAAAHFISVSGGDAAPGYLTILDAIGDPLPHSAAAHTRVGRLRPQWQNCMALPALGLRPPHAAKAMSDNHMIPDGL